MVFFVRKGVIWVFIAIVFGIVPVVSPAIYFFSRFSFSHLSFDTQVFSCLDLSGIFPLSLVVNQNVDLAL